MEKKNILIFKSCFFFFSINSSVNSLLVLVFITALPLITAFTMPVVILKKRNDLG